MILPSFKHLKSKKFESSGSQIQSTPNNLKCFVTFPIELSQRNLFVPLFLSINSILEFISFSFFNFISCAFFF